MKNKKVLFVISTVLVAGLLTGCGTGENTNGSTGGTQTEENIVAKFHPSIEIKEENDTVMVNFKVKNTSGELQKLTFSTGLKVDYIIYDENGKKVKQYSEDAMSTQAIEEITLEENQDIENGFSISDLYNGRFTIEVFLTAQEEDIKVSTDLIIEKSIYNKGKGLLIGQIDPHTIELDIDGEKGAYQLTEEAMEQLTLLNEGDTVEFIFTENDIQKTIEKFLTE
ncbi:BsuPI-related putative proteinase inhibitor [Bacillus sp. MRMR6]|uniref:BsuPI-related putative proteinase inhibitor n=1 Tax=Bacillus sp. MRMR6 TaxID=1928617 RepID=UPI000952E6DF|nr:BsuPI-related putative proteinase inhibitor [Bacillus sp. MRMR6]OLS39967.1 hypothetical protein BTR25_12290 [Bacillus sp. MRMR6]